MLVIFIITIMLLQKFKCPNEEFDVPVPNYVSTTFKFNMDHNEILIPHTLPRHIRRQIVRGMAQIQGTDALRLRADWLPAFLAFKNGTIAPYVFNYIYRSLRPRNKNDSDLKCWFKVCWVVITCNLESLNAFCD